MSTEIVNNQVQITLPEGRAAVESLTQRLIDAFIEGTEDPIRLDVQLKALEEVVKTVRSNNHVRHEVLQALSRHPEKTVEMYGAQITKKLTPARYDYSVCQDFEWRACNDLIEMHTKQRKERETFLKALKSPTTIVNDETGEVNTIYPPTMEQGETIAIKFV